MVRKSLLLLVLTGTLGVLPGCASNSCERREGLFSRLFNRNRNEVECCDVPVCCEGPSLGGGECCQGLGGAPPLMGAPGQAPMPNLVPMPPSQGQRLVPQPSATPQPYTPSSVSR